MNALTIVTLGILLAGTCTPDRATALQESTPTDASVHATPTPDAETTDSAASDSIAVDTPPLSGRWRLTETRSEKESRRQAIEAATAHLGRLQQRPARSRLTERSVPREILVIEIGPTTVKVGSPDQVMELALDGTPREISTGEGVGQMSARLDGDALVVVADLGDTQRTTTYRAEGSKLSMRVHLTSGRLSRAIEYGASYTRAEE